MFHTAVQDHHRQHRQVSSTMQNLLLVCAVALLLTACGEPPPECACPANVQLRIKSASTILSPEQSKKVLICSAKHPEGCTIDVPVVDKGAGKCEAALPYCVVCVRKNDTKDKKPFLPNVTWRLTVGGQETKAYVFTQSKGIDIKRVGDSGNDEFNDPDYAGNTSKFKWHAGPDSTPAGGLGHDARIYTADGKNQCTLPDPLIVNSGN